MIDTLVQLGRAFFALAILVLGVQQILYGDFVPGPFIAPAWIPMRAACAYASGAVLAVCGLGLLVPKEARRAAVGLSVLLLVIIVFFHAPAPGVVWRDGIARTRAFEALALFGAALAMAGLGSLAALAGRVVFAVTLVVFGIQHFMYAQFVALTVPAWMPGKLFWAYFTGVAFIAAGLSLATNVRARWAALWLGLMFFLWVIVLHAPRVAAKLHDGNEWNSAFLALAMCGASWALAAGRARGRAA